MVAGTGDDFLLPTVVAVSVVTTLTTPALVRASEPVALWIDRRLPRPLQTFVSLYASWVEQLRAQGAQTDPTGRKTPRARRRPFAIGVVRVAHALSAMLAGAALPSAVAGQLDRAAAPRRALVVTLQVALVLVVAVPLVALTQPFLPLAWGALALGVIIALLAWRFWRHAADLHQHVRAGAEVVVEALARQAGGAAPSTLAEVELLLPGLGDLTPVTLSAHSIALGRTLAEINLRAVTGAQVIAIARDRERVLVPDGREVLRAGDVLVLAGAHEAVEAAQRLLEAVGERSKSAS